MYRSESLVFIDESEFEEFQSCIYGWSKRGKKFMERNKENGEKEKI